MPFHDFCEFDDRASQFYPGDQLPVPPLRLPSASPPPAPTHEFEPSKYQGPKPEPSWVNVKPWPDVIGTQNDHRPKAFLTTPPPDDSGSNQVVLSGTARESALPSPPPTPPSVAAGLSDAPTELDLEAAAYVESAHPGAPWFRWCDTPAHPGYVIDICGRKVSLLYLCYHEVGSRTFQYGMEGCDRPIYGREVFLAPMERPKGSWPSDNEVGYFNWDPTFNFAVNQAIDIINDPGLVVEVSRFWWLSAQMPAILQRDEIIKEMIEDVQRCKDELARLNKEFANEYRQCTERLKMGHARSHVERAVKVLADERSAGGRFYWPGVPDHPLHPCQYTFPQYRCERYLQLGGGKVNVSKAIDPSSRVLARAVAKISHREKRKLSIWCKLCGEKGHFMKDCPTPHCRCEGICEVRTNHVNYLPRRCGLQCRKGMRQHREKQLPKEGQCSEGSGLRNDDMDVI